MFDLIQSELYKLKRSKLLLIVILGMMVPPTIMFIGTKFGNAGYLTLENFLNDINLYGLMLFNIIVYSLLAAYLIVKEYNDHTIKAVLTVPISRNKFILGKFVVFEVLVILLTTMVYILSVIYGTMIGTDFDLNVLGNCFIQFLMGNILLSIVITPFMFLSLIFKNVVPTVIGGVIASFSNSVMFGNTYSPLSPFCVPLLIVTNKLGEYSYGTVTPVMILILTAIFGLVLSLIYFNKCDVSL